MSFCAGLFPEELTKPTQAQDQFLKAITTQGETQMQTREADGMSSDIYYSLSSRQKAGRGQARVHNQDRAKNGTNGMQARGQGRAEWSGSRAQSQDRQRVRTRRTRKVRRETYHNHHYCTQTMWVDSLSLYG